MNDTFLTQAAIKKLIQSERKYKSYLTEEELYRYCKYVYLRRKLGRLAYDKGEPEGSDLEVRCFKEIKRQYEFAKDVIDKINRHHKDHVGEMYLSAYV